MGFADGLNAGASAASKWVGAYKQGREWIKENDLRDTQEAAQKAWDERKSAIDADTSMTQYDRDQAHAEARGQYYDTMQKKYEHYGMGAEFNNMVTAAGNAREEARNSMLDRHQQSAYNQELKAQQVTGQKKFAMLVDKARNGDKDALEYLNDVADYNGVQMTMKDGQFMWSPKGSDAAPVPMDMAQAYDGYTAFTGLEDRLRKRLQAEALLKGDAGKLDKHIGEQADLEKTKAVTQGLKIANDKASSPYYEYTTDDNGRVTRAKIDPVTKKRLEVVGEDYNEMGEFHHGNATGGLKTLGNTNENVQSALGSVPTSVRDSGRFSNVRTHYGKDKNGNQVPMVTFQDYKLDKNGKPVKDKDGKPVLEEKTMQEAAFIQAVKVNFGKKKKAKAISDTPQGTD